MTQGQNKFKSDKAKCLAPTNVRNEEKVAFTAKSEGDEKAIIFLFFRYKEGVQG